MQTLTEYLEPGRLAIPDAASRDLYTRLIARCERDLRPLGILEVMFAAFVVRALWRLDRGSLSAEADIARTENSIRRNTAELRRLQTDRHLQAELNLRLPGLISVRDVLKWLKHEKSEKRKNEPISLARTIETTIHSQIEEEEQRELAEFALRTRQQGGTVPRNAPCPCGSGQKHKRCCGKDAAPVYATAAKPAAPAAVAPETSATPPESAPQTSRPPAANATHRRA